MVIDIMLPVLLLIGLLLLGTPVAFALAISGTFGLLLVAPSGTTTAILVEVTYNNVAGFLLTTIPMFVLMAMLLDESDLTEVVFEAVHRWLSNVKGGMAIATTIANGGMAAMSGSSTATAATMSQVAVPEMQKHGYDDRLSLGTVAAAGTFAVTIPPSLGLIVFGIITETSVAALFIGGIIPGILTLVGYAGVIYVWGSYNPDVIGGVAESFTWEERFASLKPIWPALVVVALVIGGLYLGVVTPTEAGALGAAGVLVVGIVVGGMRASGIQRALLKAAETSVMIFMIIIGAMIFGRYLAFSGVTQLFIETVAGLPFNRWTILLILLAMYVLMGTMMDQLAILILTLPLTFPLAMELGFDPIFFGILIAKTIEIGLVTPPLGLNVYVACGTLDMDVTTGFKGAIMFIPVDIAIIGLIMLVPETVTYLIPA